MGSVAPVAWGRWQGHLAGLLRDWWGGSPCFKPRLPPSSSFFSITGPDVRRPEGTGSSSAPASGEKPGFPFPGAQTQAGPAGAPRGALKREAFSPPAGARWDCHGPGEAAGWGRWGCGDKADLLISQRQDHGGGNKNQCLLNKGKKSPCLGGEKVYFQVY